MNAPAKVSSAIPFDAARLDKLMDAAGMDVLIATSKHNVQYLLGGHRAFFFDYMDAMGLSRYLPVLVYAKGAPDKAAYFGHRLENFQRENHPFWTPVQQCNSSGSIEAFNINLLQQKGSLFCTRPTLNTYAAKREDLLSIANNLFSVVASGKVKIPVNQKYALKDAQQSHRDLEARKTTGSTVLLP